MKVFVLAGGGGTRLWPLSRRNYPKQFLRLNSEQSLLQQTLERLYKIVNLEDIFIVTNNDYKFYVLSDIASLSRPLSDRQVLLEPTARNTAPAIALSIRHCLDNLGCSPDEIMLVCPSDHILSPDEGFIEPVRYADALARQGYLVTFGVTPTRPETGYGYIETGTEGIKIVDRVLPKVERFIEKPDLQRAQSFVNSGNYYWNSGIFAFRLDTMMHEMGLHAPEVATLFDTPLEGLKGAFKSLPNISIDYAVLEKSSKVVLVPLTLKWNDIGSWDAIYDVLEKDQNGNALKGDITVIDTKNSMIISTHHHIAAIGIEDCLIIDTPDATLVAKRGDSQRVKDVVNVLKGSNRPESEEHTTCFRPWGSFTVLEEGQRYKIKRIVVHPTERLSLQMHHHRSEHWVVVKGTAKATIGDKTLFVHENESVFVPKSTVHRLENPGKIPLEIIEVQNGEYVGEDDIIRLEDKYCREECP
jgi:mannose-1-phosphate guanylyltransferase/mannose-6-phosphate isomerase